MNLLIATTNPDKVVEFRRILEPLGVDLVTPKEIGVLGDVEETGSTFIENARLKAYELFEKTGIPTIADDSGLCIDAMEGEPGVYTARYGGDDTTYPERFKLIFDHLKDIPKEQRTAKFVCSIFCVLGKNSVIETTGECDGWIGYEPKGTDGFGYDPIFYIGEKSFAEYSTAEKDELSHRGKALRQFAKHFEQELANIKGE